jgi:hypothetical protein
MDRKKETVRAGANMGDVVAALPVARFVRPPCHCPGARKALAGYLIGTGHFFAGAVTFITAEVLKLTFVERLFHLNRTKLLSIPAFAWGYRYWRPVMDVVESLEVWKVSRQLAHRTGQFFQSRWLHFKAARRQPRSYDRAVVRRQW